MSEKLYRWLSNAVAVLAGIAIGSMVVSIRMPSKQPVNQIVASNTFQHVGPRRFWDEGKVYVTVHYWTNNDTWAMHFQPTNRWAEIVMWLDLRSERRSDFFILPTNIPSAPMRP